MGRITLWGFYQFSDKKLFDDITLYEEFDKQTLIDLILQQSGELFPFHQQPDFLKRNIESWFARMYEQFKRMYDTLYSDYVPTENYDRMEAWSDSASSSESAFNSESSSSSTSASSSESSSESSSTSTSGSAHDATSDSNSNSLLNNVSAFDTSALSPESAASGQTAGRSSADTNNHTQTVTGSTGVNGRIGNRHDTANATTINRRQGTNDKIDYSFHEGRVHGNIGVMTTQAMIKEEIELRKFDIYETIANMFEEEFLIRRY